MNGREFEYLAPKLRFRVVNTVELIFAKLEGKKQLTFKVKSQFLLINF